MRVCNDPIVFWYFELPTSVIKLPLFIFKLAPNKDRKLYMYIEKWSLLATMPTVRILNTVSVYERYMYMYMYIQCRFQVGSVCPVGDVLVLKWFIFH